MRPSLPTCSFCSLRFQHVFSFTFCCLCKLRFVTAVVAVASTTASHATAAAADVAVLVVAAATSFAIRLVWVVWVYGCGCVRVCSLAVSIRHLLRTRSLTLLDIQMYASMHAYMHIHTYACMHVFFAIATSLGLAHVSDLFLIFAQKFN